MACWKIPELNGGFNRNITYFYGPFSIATFEHQRVFQMKLTKSPKMLGSARQALHTLGQESLRRAAGFWPKSLAHRRDMKLEIQVCVVIHGSLWWCFLSWLLMMIAIEGEECSLDWFCWICRTSIFLFEIWVRCPYPYLFVLHQSMGTKTPTKMKTNID